MFTRAYTSESRWKQRWSALVSLIAVCFFYTMPVLGQASEWVVGALIGLREGVCIRDGPGYSYRAHTRVPEDNWTVMVIDGPRTTDGRVWYDTSRRAAGDPSGGTGWVLADWSDQDCSLSTAPASSNDANVQTETDSWLTRIREWWAEQTPTVQWTVALIGVAFVVAGWRRVGFYLVNLLFAFIAAVILGVIMDSTRDVWQAPWQGVVGRNGPDLALLVASIPLVGWMLRFLRGGRFG